MKIHRFIENLDLSKKNIKIFDAGFYNQIKNVLRLKAGDRIILCDGQSNEAVCQITGFDKKFVELEVLEKNKNENEPKKNIILFCAILKRENFEFVVQKATELGVKEIYPIISQRTVKFNLKEERIKKIIKEAAEQSGRSIVPILNKPLNFKEALNISADNQINLFFDKSGEAFNPCGITNNNLVKIGIFIGPEGGWNEEEIKIVKKMSEKNPSFKIISLGKLTLRAETAAIIASYLAGIFKDVGRP